MSVNVGPLFFGIAAHEVRDCREAVPDRGIALTPHVRSVGQEAEAARSFDGLGNDSAPDLQIRTSCHGQHI